MTGEATADFRQLLAEASGKAAKFGRETDFRDEEGLLHCGVCGEAKEFRGAFFGVEQTVFCICRCQQRELEAREAARNAANAELRIQRLRQEGIADVGARNFRFRTAEETPEIKTCKAYVENWERMAAENIGLLLWGAPGGGKTFAACCIANALIERGVNAMVTSFPAILQRDFDKTAVLEQMRRCDLVVIDDLGVERSSEYATEAVYLTVDERYKSGKPLIVTTNLTPEWMQQKERGLERQRIYQRILDICVPVRFSERDFRRNGAKKRLQTAAELLKPREART